MAEASTLHDAFIDELRDLYDAEKQLTKALPKLAKAASNSDLRQAFERGRDAGRIADEIADRERELATALELDPRLGEAPDPQLGPRQIGKDRDPSPRSPRRRADVEDGRLVLGEVAVGEVQAGDVHAGRRRRALDAASPNDASDVR